MKIGIAYLFRSFILFGALALLWAIPLADRIITLGEFEILHYVVRQDVLRAMFFSLGLVALIAWFFPLRWLSKQKPSIKLISALSVAGFGALLPVYGLLSVRGTIILPVLVIPAVGYIFINLLAMVITGGQEEFRDSRPAKRIRRAFPLSDTLLPGALFAGYVPHPSKLFSLLRIIPAVLICLPLAYITISNLPKTGLPNSYSSGIDRVNYFEGEIVDRSFHDVKLNSEGHPVLVDDRSVLTLVDPVNRRAIANRPLKKNCAIGFSMGPKGETVMVLNNDPSEFLFTWFDTKNLNIQKEENYFLDDANNFGWSMSLWDPQRDIQLGVTAGGTLKSDLEKGEPTDLLRAYPDHAVLDPNRNSFYLCFHIETVIAEHDTNTLELKRTVKVPQLASRMAIDPVTDRLYVSFPAEGVIRVIDLNNFEVVDTVFSFYGVRTIFVDAERRLLFFSGLPPFMEVRSADDFSLISRLSTPSWIRAMATDPKKPIAYLATFEGLFEMDLNRVDRGAAALLFAKSDPYFLISSMLGKLVQKLDAANPKGHKSYDYKVFEFSRQE